MSLCQDSAFCSENLSCNFVILRFVSIISHAKDSCSSTGDVEDGVIVEIDSGVNN